MPDNKTKRGKPDRIRVSLLEDYEIRYLAQKFKTTMKKVRQIIKRVGNMRKDVMAALEANRRLRRRLRLEGKSK